MSYPEEGYISKDIISYPYIQKSPEGYFLSLFGAGYFWEQNFFVVSTFDII
jgi:hypothetical protein